MYPERFKDWCQEHLQDLLPALRERTLFPLLLSEEDGRLFYGFFPKEGTLEEQDGEPPLFLAFDYREGGFLLLLHQAPTEGNESYLQSEDWKLLSKCFPYGMGLRYVDRTLFLKGRCDFRLEHKTREEITFPTREVREMVLSGHDFLRSLVPYFRKEAPERRKPEYLRAHQNRRRKVGRY